MHLRNLSTFVKKIPTSFLAPLLGTGFYLFLNLVHSRICILFFFIKTKNISFTFSIINPTSNPYWSDLKGEFTEPPPKPNLSSGGELHPSLKTMV
jgi:hypothetical protein